MKFLSPICVLIGSLLTRIIPYKIKNNLKLNKFKLNISKTPFLDALIAIEPSLRHRYFFPGHSGHTEFIPPHLLANIPEIREIFKYDVPELDGLDNIHQPEGPLLDSLVLAAHYFDAYKTWFLVNGSTSGIMIAILTCFRLFQQQSRIYNNDNNVDNNDKNSNKDNYFIIGRDSHKSVFDAISLVGSDAIILPCRIDTTFQISLGIDFTELENILQLYKNKISGLIFTRPTYHGVGCSTETLRNIVDLCHKYEVPVIIDEAHGSHLHLVNNIHLLNGLDCGADIVIQSTHKTLTSLSQTAMMHLNKDAFPYLHNTEDVDRILQNSFSMLTTTSPNSILLASLDATRAQLQDNGQDAIQYALSAINIIKNTCRMYPKNIILLEDSKEIRSKQLYVDPLRFTIQFLGVNNLDIDDIMCEQDGIYCELNQESCITYNIPLFSNLTYLEPLHQSLLNILKKASLQNIVDNEEACLPTELVKVIDDVSILRSKDVLYRRSRPCTIKDTLGHISAETICVYPPGIPILIAGEVISLIHINTLLALQKNRQNLGSGNTVTGMSDSNMDSILIIDNLN